ncbi:TetR family transcriptional regulator [Limnobacter thiooxidans]|uniref:TetR/AcrR family transcriptional regulator n=1 Tax=Limnobacter thiooxidans TaxID=131080 RepID=A0AA86JJL0_9BURK|nr:TetR family transcriptional regulator [Limnobacter sp.]MCZ8015838.1 TetR family transcriptional regulator [Limnobacter sp.]RZS42920.1 TetR family transcriptional regulator [Limnobacter thiooxidans]BET25642.1 TetR/AcrR family transcriptional regulator [Limnobacter thiooxidans]
MPRPRTIDREHLLDVAEELLAKSGGNGLSFGTLAAEAKLPKASIQSAFGTRENLIESMLDRWIADEQTRFDECAGLDPDKQRRVLAHIQTTEGESDTSLRRVATLLAAMMGSTQQVKRSIDWYASRIGDLNVVNEEDRRLRAAFLATEGAFFMRYLIGFDVSDEVWSEVFKDIKQMVLATKS